MNVKRMAILAMCVFVLMAGILHAQALKCRWVNVPADRQGDGFDKQQIRSDFEEDYQGAYQEVKSFKGGILTSSGGKRELSAPVTAGRSPTSLHYLGRALDLYIYTGMKSKNDKYVIVRDGGTGEHPLWRVYCRVEDGKVPIQTLKGSIWVKGRDPAEFTIAGRFISITDIMKRHGFERIASRSGWKNTYLCMEWWHFQNEKGLKQNESTFQGELSLIYTKKEIESSPLKNTKAVWRGHGFKLAAD
jgi:hypothetical protein